MIPRKIKTTITQRNESMSLFVTLDKTEMKVFENGSERTETIPSDVSTLFGLLRIVSLLPIEQRKLYAFGGILERDRVLGPVTIENMGLHKGGVPLAPRNDLTRYRVLSKDQGPISCWVTDKGRLAQVQFFPQNWLTRVDDLTENDKE